MKTFKQFIFQKTPIAEGIAHIDDLDIDEFISAVENIDKMKASNKLDGTNMWFGLDEEGKFYTSRQGKIKTADRKYKAEDHGYTIGTNGIRGAHLALEQHLSTIKKALEPGDTIECEILFGEQPNAIDYEDGTSSISIIRGVNETPDERVEALTQALNDKRAKVESVIMDTSDGKTLVKKEEKIKWKFEPVENFKLDGGTIKAVKAKATALQHYLDSKNEALGMTNREVLKSHKKDITDEKQAILDTINKDYKLVIKQAILDDVKTTVKKKSKDGEIEGAVFADPKSESQFKVVDKDVFTAINKFNYEVRNNISGIVKTDDPMADKALRGGLFGEAKIRLANLFGIQGLAVAANQKKILTKFKGASQEETLRNIVKNFEGLDTQAVRKKAIAILGSAIDELDEYLKQFKESNEEYEMELKDGKVAKYTPEIVKRTLLNFATTRTIMVELFEKLKNAKSMAQLVIALFGKKIIQINAEQDEADE